MKLLTILENNVLAAFHSADQNGKDFLSTLFGSEVFNRKITDRVTNFGDVLAILGMDKTKFAAATACLPADELAYIKLKLVAQVLNDGWKPDWNNSNQYKYFPYFNMYNGFSFRSVVSLCQISYVGSRLCFKSRELVQHAVKHFLDIYKDFHTILG